MTALSYHRKMYRLIRPLLFALPPEAAHDFTLASLRLAGRLGIAGALSPRVRSSPTRVMGLDFPNPVGLSAGLDKNGRCIGAFAQMGFGFLEIGTVTPRPQPGNQKPRMFRIPAASAVINRMGFNNGGIDALVDNVRAAGYTGILGINIGKNLDTPMEHAVDDYVVGMNKAYQYASYVTINISSPNTRNLRLLQESAELGRLLAAIASEREKLSDRHGRRVPLALKIAPDLEDAQIGEIAELVVAHGVDALIATNTTVAKDGVACLPHGGEAGGLSGAPLTVPARSMLARFAAMLQGAVPIIGSGGIMSGADAAASVTAGASLVQLYTGLVYAGPALIAECADAIDNVRPPILTK